MSGDGFVYIFSDVFLIRHDSVRAVTGDYHLRHVFGKQMRWHDSSTSDASLGTYLIIILRHWRSSCPKQNFLFTVKFYPSPLSCLKQLNVLKFRLTFFYPANYTASRKRSPTF